MTTLYREITIETAEQAEALPPGTLAYDPEADSLVGIRMPDSDRFGWSCSFDHDPTAYSSSVVGWTALVPIEAEEEFQDIDAYEASGHMRRHHLTRYTTPWEAVS